MIDHRFLRITDTDSICFCSTCQAPITTCMATQAQAKDIEAGSGLIKRFIPETGPPMEHDYPFQKLEKLLANRNMPIIKQRGEDLFQIRYELDEYQKSKVLDPSADFRLMSEIEAGKKLLDIIKTHDKKLADLLKHISTSMSKREAHKNYLKLIKEGRAEINIAKEAHGEKVRKHIKYLSQALDVSRGAILPQIIKSKANGFGTPLKFTPLYKKRQNAMKASLSNALKVATYPSATHSLPWLRAKKVVARMSNELNAKHKDQYGNLFFKFTLLASGDWQVIVQHISTRDTHVLFAFEISRQKVEMMQYAGKLTKEPFPPDTEFVVMNCFCLLQLLGRIRSSE